MSTNKTQNYSLHAWEPGDDFLREEINENFGLLDAAARMVFGTYIGDGEKTQHIELGEEPKAVYIGRKDGNTGNNFNVFTGLFGSGTTLGNNYAGTDDTGFWVASVNSSSRVNDLNAVYHYIAFF